MCLARRKHHARTSVWYFVQCATVKVSVAASVMIAGFWDSKQRDSVDRYQNMRHQILENRNIGCSCDQLF